MIVNSFLGMEFFSLSRAAEQNLRMQIWFYVCNSDQSLRSAGTHELGVSSKKLSGAKGPYTESRLKSRDKGQDCSSGTFPHNGTQLCAVLATSLLHNAGTRCFG